MGYEELSGALVRTLGFELPPVAVAFVEEPPPGVAALEGEVPSACSLWRKAEAGVFYAAAQQHFNCLVGAMVMGFELGDEEHEQLMGLAQKMLACGYLAPDEPQRLPSVRKHKSGIVYGPLRDFPLEPDLVLLWLSPHQAMLFNEGVGSAAWTNAPTPAFGRPGCAALPMAHNDQQVALSLGCLGMRTFTGIGDDRVLAVLPGSQMDGLLYALQATERANESMGEYYRQQQAKFPS